MSLYDAFLAPQVLPLLVALPLTAFVGLRALDGARARRLQHAIGPRAPILAGDLHRGRRRTRRALLTAGLAFASLAAMQPSWGMVVRDVAQRGVDLVVCLDVSRSMLARDLAPNRLERAHREIRALAERVRGDRMALVAFAGEARLTIPLTRDTETFADLVERTDWLSVDRGGTDLGAALETALDALGGTSGNHEAVILITDGEDHEQRGLAAAQACSERNVAVHCVGLGSTLGSKIPIAEAGETSGESFLRTRTGDDVLSVLDVDGLRAIADTTGGSFVEASASPRPLLDLYETRLGPLAAKSFDATDEQRNRANRFQWPLLIAFLLLIAELALTDRVRR